MRADASPRAPGDRSCPDLNRRDALRLTVSGLTAAGQLGKGPLGVRVRADAVPTGPAQEVLAAHHGAGGSGPLRRLVRRQPPMGMDAATRSANRVAAAIDAL